jgi:hypothetical protein
VGLYPTSSSKINIGGIESCPTKIFIYFSLSWEGVALPTRKHPLVPSPKHGTERSPSKGTKKICVFYKSSLEGGFMWVFLSSNKPPQSKI